jgi:hypothetical protein
VHCLPAYCNAAPGLAWRVPVGAKIIGEIRGGSKVTGGFNHELFDFSGVEKFMVAKFMIEKFMVEKFTVENFMVEKFMVEKFMVEKFMVEKFMVEKLIMEKFILKKFIAKKFTFEKFKFISRCVIVLTGSISISSTNSN